jgi:hypothetical protein
MAHGKRLLVRKIKVPTHDAQGIAGGVFCLDFTWFIKCVVDVLQSRLRLVIGMSRVANQ